MWAQRFLEYVNVLENVVPMRCRGQSAKGGQSIQVFPGLTSDCEVCCEFRRLKTLHSKVIYTGKFFKETP